MNPALFAANRSAMQRLQILPRLHQEGATSRGKAIAVDSLPAEMQAQANYYIAKGILRTTPDGGLYIDKRAYEDYQAGMKTAGKWVLAAVGVASLAGVILLLANRI